MRRALSNSRALGARAGGGRGGPARAVGRVVALSMLFVLSIGSAADADVGTTIINRCTHGQSLNGFSQEAYRRALQELPTEVEEYSDCGRLIRRAQAAAAGGGAAGAGPAGGAVPIPLTPTENAALRRAAHTGSTPLHVGGEVVNPGIVHADIASALSSLPTPLLAILAFLLLCAGVLAGGALRNRVRSRRSS